MIATVGIVLLAIVGVGLNAFAAWRLAPRKRPAPVAECDDGSIVRLASIPSLVDHVARTVDPDNGWMQTFSGRRFYPLAPKAADVELADVAHGLAMVCRYGGHARKFYSVAEHCVLVSEFVELHARNAGRSPEDVKRLAQLALMHDSAEAYIGDMIRPLKHQPEMSEFRRAEAAIEIAIAEAFKLRWTPEAHEIVKRIDDRILVDEISHLMPEPEMYLRPWLQDMSPLGAHFRCMSPDVAKSAFLARYREVFR